MRLLPFAAAAVLFAGLTAHADTMYSIGISTTVHGAPAEYSFRFDTAQLQAMDGSLFATEPLTASLTTTAPPAIDSVEVEFGSDGSTPFFIDGTNHTTVFFGGNSTAVGDISRLIAGTYNVELDNQPMGPSAGQSTVTISETMTPPNTAIAPEPGTFVLLATGVLGACGVLKRRLLS